MGLNTTMVKTRKPKKIQNTSILLRKHLVELQQYYLKYRSLYECISDPLRFINAEGIILDCNKSYETLLGYTKNEMIGTSIFSHTAEQSLDAMNDLFEIWKNIGKASNREIWLKRKNRTTFPVMINTNTVYGYDGSIIGSNTIIRDISELQILREVEKAKKELEKKEIQKEKFVTMVTHDLKNYLVPIWLHCELLKDAKGLGSLNPEQLDAVDEIELTSKKLGRLVSDIHDVHRLDLKQMKFNKQVFNVNQLLDSITKNHLPLMNQRKVQLVSSPTHKTLTITSDEDRLFQVFSNLIKNAIDFLPKENPRIEFGVMYEDRYLVFYVKDNGVGVPTVEQEKLFREFFQVDETNKGIHIGSGLGLTICKGIVEGMGGRLWVESKEGVGTTFYFSIPKEVVKNK